MKSLVTKDKELTEKQVSFMTHYFDVDNPQTFSNARQSCAAAGYASSSYPTVLTQLREEIIERAKLEMAVTSPRAVKQIVDSMTAAHTEGEPLGRTELRFKAAQDILDRSGISRRQEAVIETKNLHTVVILPQKSQYEPVEIFNPDDRSS